MPLKFALYPGCAAKGATPELYQSTMAIVGRLGIEVVELAASSCCGAGVIGEADPDLALALNARTFAQAERMGLDVMTICGTCQGVMSAANRRLKSEPATLERVNKILAQDGISYGGGVQVKHLLWIAVRDLGLSQVAGTVRSPFRDFRIAPFYGWLMWLNPDGTQFPGASKTASFMIGAGGHYTWVEPACDAVVVVRWIDSAHAPEFIARVATALQQNA